MKSVYFIGIGGIGMSALAQYFKDKGAQVSGSDREAGPVTELLLQKGIAVIIGQKKENVPKDADVVVYSDAVPADNVERTAAEEFGIEQLSYFQMLGKISEGKRTVAVAGTHGKTTTTGMLAKILRDAGASPTAIVGSIVRDFESNYLHGESEVLVVEACEYRDHVLELTPEILVITNLEWDHTDFFPTLTALQETFRKTIGRLPKNGVLVTNPADQNIAPLLASATCKVVDYTKEPSFELLLPGEFNEMNARAAVAAARATLPTLTTEQAAASLFAFQGTWRRFEYKGKTKNGADVYDDYAHHPTAVKKTLEALRAKTQGKVYVAFHPHLYSRTRDLFDDFAQAFGAADGAFIAPIYAAREVDDGSVSSEMLAKRITENGTPAEALSFEEIQRAFETSAQAGDSIMTMGAGDIYKVADRLVKP